MKGYSDIKKAYDEYRRNGGRLRHSADPAGISFEQNGISYFIYIGRIGGLFCEYTANDVQTVQLAGTYQFFGKTSKAVKRWMDA